MTTEEAEPGQPQPFNVESADFGERWCQLTVRGDVDVDTAPRLENAVEDALRRGRRHVAVDMSSVSFMDSTALRALLRAREDARADGGSLRVTRASRAVVLLLELTDLTDLLGTGDEAPTSEGIEPPG
jgi:anti-sigma B factor antagonist